MPHRPGLSLVEVLVVLALVGVLLLCLFPAVTKVSTAAARTMCQNNLKVLALGCQAHADYAPPGGKAPGHFPPGTVPHPALPPDDRLSWFVTLLPFVEQEALHRRFDLAAGADANAGAADVVKGYRCPVGPDDVPGGEPAAHYVGVAGVGWDAAALPAGHERAGAFGHDRATRPADLPAGGSHTLLVVEALAGHRGWFRGRFITVRGVDPADSRPVGKNRAFGGRHEHGGGWRPPSGANAAFADGSVRVLPPDINPAVLAALATVAGGELPPDW